MVRRLRPDPPPEEAPPPPQPTQLNCNISGPDDATVAAGTLAYTDLRLDDPTHTINYGGRVEEDGRFIIRFPGCAPKGQGANMTVMVPGGKWEGRVVLPSEGAKEMGSEGGDAAIVLVRSSTSPFRREGIVRASGRCWIDDTGAFYPLGHTLFWALRGWKFERDRIKQNIEFLKGKGDYIRILGDVGWTNNEIDPTWPDYESLLAELVEWTYQECGLRTQLTVTGGGPWNHVDTAQRCANVIQGRWQMFAKLEGANEAYNNCSDWDTLNTICMVLREAAPENLVALSASHDGYPGTPEKFMTADNSNMVVAHLSRQYGDDGWRHVRQGWDFQHTHYASSSNEPIGPASSVEPEDDPLRLAMARATGVMCGGEDYVFHNGAGIFGYPNTPGTGVPRTANLWEMPNIDAIMSAVQRVTSILPTGMANWRAVNDGWVPPNPVIPLACVDWNDAVGPIKNYGALSPDGRWTQMPHGIKGHFRAKATQALSYRAYDPLSLAVVSEGHLNAGQEMTLPGPSNNRQCAYVIVGRFNSGKSVPADDESLPDEHER